MRMPPSMARMLSAGSSVVRNRPKLAGASSTTVRAIMATKAALSQAENQASMRSGPRPERRSIAISSSIDWSGNLVVWRSPEKRSSSLLQISFGPRSRVTSMSATPELCVPEAQMPPR